jgi:hypothetical protein
MLTELARRALLAVGLEDVWLAYGAKPLREDGWLRSRRENRCVDRDGRPLPWLTYPAIDFLSRRIRKDMVVFEYGCGASTLWWAKRTARVIAVEHDPVWAAKIASEAPPNATVNQVALEPEGPYVENIKAHGIRFDVVVIDGRQRVRCVPHAMEALSPAGVVVFDNTDREEYAEGIRRLLDGGFRKVEFVGLGPIVDYKFETTVLYRTGNCLGL